MEEPIQHFVALIRRKAAEARRGDYAFLELIAHLFAALTQLSGRFGDAELEGLEPPRPLTLLDDVLETLEQSDPAMPLPRLYESWTSALVALEQEISHARDALLLSREVQLEVLVVDGCALLGGVVQLWVRPKSRLAALRSKRRAVAPVEPGSAVARPMLGAAKSQQPGLLARRPMSLREHPAHHLKVLGLYWASDAQLPIARRVRIDDPIRVPLVYDSGRSDFRIALCPLIGEAHPLLTLTDEGGRFHVFPGEPMHKPELLMASLSTLVEEAARQNVQLLVLPELTIDLAAREHLRACLSTLVSGSLMGLVAGSFHVWSQNARLPINESLLYDHSGELLLAHHKRGRFRMTPEDFNAAAPFFRACERFRSHPELLRREIFENIDQGSSLQFLETALGRLVLLICADAIEPDERGFIPVVERLRPDLLLVVSMSPATERFEELAEAMARFDIGTIFVNASCICRREKSPCLAFADLALLTLEGHPPSRVRWRLGHDLEYFERHAHHRSAGMPWLPADDRMTEVGAMWLEVEGQRAALILDLGTHFGSPCQTVSKV